MSDIQSAVGLYVAGSVGENARPLYLLPSMANRHGMIAGATGTGKTVSVRVLAEAFSDIGVPVFLTDIKGDLGGMAQTGESNPRVEERVAQLAMSDFEYSMFPVVFWDVWGEHGHPVRATISDMGPLLLSRLLNLNETQSGVLSIVFRVADDNGFLLLDLKDLRAMIQHVAEHAREYKTQYGNISPASIGAIQRGLLALEDQGGARFFGEPALDLDDLMQTDSMGRGVVNILAAERLMQSPTLYSAFLMWLLSELFERLPEIGDVEKPRLVFFFDEAHLFFDEAPPALREKIEQVVRLIRSKGVGVYFISQNPLDIPDEVLGQLGNRVQHALRAFSPRDQKAVKAAATTFRANENLDVESVITQLSVGEALVSTLQSDGTPSVVERALIAPPRSKLGVIEPAKRAAHIQNSLLSGVYEQAVDRESAYEMLQRRAQENAQQQQYAAQMSAQQTQHPPGVGAAPRGRSAPGGSDILRSAAQSAARAVGSQVGRQIVRGLLGSILGGSGRRRGW